MSTASSVEELILEATNVFRKEFDEEPDTAAVAPGRVNLIGEHTDYNDGFVLPMALPLVTVIVGRKTSEGSSTIITTDPQLKEHDRVTLPNKQALTQQACNKGPRWANYVKGVLANYIGLTPSFQCVIVSNVPMGGGLSSSAALEVATYTFLDALNGSDACTVMPTDKALACQKAEHDFAGVPCGIMDQFISVLGKADNALLIDCRTMTSKLIPFNEPNILVLITNSNVRHELTGSEYATRRKQCEEAALLIKKLSLRDANMQDINYLKSIDTDNEIVKRASHVISEIDRTVRAAEALQERNFIKFGELMTESHQSLKSDFEVSCPELDELVELALQVPGVLGSRMTGGGFGGCTVTLVYSHNIEELKEHIKEKYSGTPTFFVCKPCDGARIINL